MQAWHALANSPVDFRWRWPERRERKNPQIPGPPTLWNYVPGQTSWKGNHWRRHVESQLTCDRTALSLNEEADTDLPSKGGREICRPGGSLREAKDRQTKIARVEISSDTEA